MRHLYGRERPDLFVRRQLDSGATEAAFRVGAGRGEICHMHEVVPPRNITERGGIREFYRVPEKFGIGVGTAYRAAAWKRSL